jgi:hypothetical protein
MLERERRENSDLDGGIDIRARGHRQEAVRARKEPLHNSTDFEHPLCVSLFEKEPIFPALSGDGSLFEEGDPGKQLGLFN